MSGQAPERPDYLRGYAETGLSVHGVRVRDDDPRPLSHGHGPADALCGKRVATHHTAWTGAEPRACRACVRVAAAEARQLVVEHHGRRFRLTHAQEAYLRAIDDLGRIKQGWGGYGSTQVVRRLEELGLVRLQEFPNHPWKVSIRDKGRELIERNRRSE